MQRVALKSPSTRTINKTLTLLVMIFNYACRHRLVDFNPAEHVEKLKHEFFANDQSIDSSVLSPSEIRKLIYSAEPERHDKSGTLRSNNYRLIIQFAVFTGMRSGEIRGLRDWKLACPTGANDLVFPNLAGNPIGSANLLQRGFYPALRRAGLRKIRFHDLRHTFASLLIASGEDIVKVSRLLGHSSPTVTLNVYAHMLPNDHYGSADRLETYVLGARKPASLVRGSD